MTNDQILSLAPALDEYLGEFADCFGRSETRGHLSHYVRGQLSNLQRKSVEPIALLNNVAPSTLQEFLGSDVWDHPGARDRVQQLVARDHEDPKAIGIFDDSGHPKSGALTPGVQWHVNRHPKRGHFRREDEPPCRLPIAQRLELAGDSQNRVGRVSGRNGSDFR